MRRKVQLQGERQADLVQGRRTEGPVPGGRELLRQLPGERIREGECTPPKLDIAFSAAAQGSASADAALMVEAIRLHLPEILLVFQARGQAFIDLSGKVVASGSATLNPGKLGVKGTACLAAIVPVVVQAGANVKAAVEASASVAGEFQL